MEANRISYWKNKPTWTIRQMAFLLREFEPISLEPLNELQRQLIANDLSNWAAWVYGCPEVHLAEQMPMDTSYNVRELLRWVQSLDGVEIPLCWQSLIESDDSTQAIGDRERENLLLTIGALAMIVVDKTKESTGNHEKPNLSGLANLCVKQAGSSKGMAVSTLRDRLSQGIDLLKEKK
jgi:hypothetical protein